MAANTLDLEGKAGGARRMIYLIIGFPLLMIALAMIQIRFQLGWIGATGIVVIAMAMTFLLIRASEAKMRALGCVSPAILRYNRRMVAASMVYMAALFASIYAYKTWHLGGALLWGAAFATALPVLAMVWAMGRLVVEESDEYLRSRIVRQALFGTGGLLAVATVWGFLEQFMLVPHVPAWAAVPVFAIMLGVAALLPANRS